jgi:hypothetical protein
MDVAYWWYAYPHTWAGLTTQVIMGFSFTLAHAIGSFAIALAVGPELVRMLERFGRRLHTEIIWDNAPPPGERPAYKRYARPEGAPTSSPLRS